MLAGTKEKEWTDVLESLHHNFIPEKPLLICACYEYRARVGAVAVLQIG